MLQHFYVGLQRMFCIFTISHIQLEIYIVLCWSSVRYWPRYNWQNKRAQSKYKEWNEQVLIDQYCVDLNGHAVVNIYPALLWQQLYLIWLCNNGCRLTNTLPPHNKMAFDGPTIPEMALPEHNRWRYTSTCCLKRSPTNCSYLVFDLTIYCRVFVGESFKRQP